RTTGVERAGVVPQTRADASAEESHLARARATTGRRGVLRRMMNAPHIAVCICTYRRVRLLTRLLDELACQETGGLFTYSVVVADNDESQSARAVVDDFASRCAIPITYCVEPRQNIALTRNKALEHAAGDFVAFIDDDEFPTKRWLLTLFNACRTYGTDGALGPVKPHFDERPPQWVVDGKLYDRP